MIQMIRKSLFLLSFLLSFLRPFSLSAQLSLEACREAARCHYPLVKQYALVEQSRDFTVANAAKGHLPAIGVSAGANVFTDLQEKPTQGVKAGHELYAAVLQVKQTLYDGGEVRLQKQASRAEAEVERRRLDVEMRQVRDRVDAIFFGLLVLEAQIANNRLLQSNLAIGLSTVGSLQAHGLATAGDCDAVRVEMLRAKQGELALVASRAAYTQMLGAFIGEELRDSVALLRPEPGECDERPEPAFFRAQEQQLDVARRSLDSRLFPRLSAFGVAALHNRPLPSVRRGQLAAGISLVWNFSPVYTRRNDLRLLALSQDRIASARATFLFNNRLQHTEASRNVDRLRSQLALDGEIVMLRERVLRTTRRKVELGTETVNELLRAINDVAEARQSEQLHEVELLRETIRKAGTAE